MSKVRSNPYVTALKTIPGLRVTQNANLSKRTSMRMRARCAALAEPQTPEALMRTVIMARDLNWPLLMLGLGKNTIFANSYFDGIVVILPMSGFGHFERLDRNVISVGAGMSLGGLLTKIKREGLMGLEFMTKIPGTVGGSLAGNAGAGEFGLCDFAERVLLMTRDGELVTLHRGEYEYGYRKSELADYIVLEADFYLDRLDLDKSEKLAQYYADKKKGQPYNVPSAGCIFKNPKNPDSGDPISAGKLIDQLGLKGYRLNGVEVSPGHANFLTNPESCARGEDLLAAIRLLQDFVQDKFGIELEIEARIVGGGMTTCRIH
ncbi:MAG: UDP-N-acetylmuramate dehydrogenase [Sumerlaeia bacterium]